MDGKALPRVAFFCLSISPASFKPPKEPKKAKKKMANSFIQSDSVLRFFLLHPSCVCVLHSAVASFFCVLFIYFITTGGMLSLLVPAPAFSQWQQQQKTSYNFHCILNYILYEKYKQFMEIISGEKKKST